MIAQPPPTPLNPSAPDRGAGDLAYLLITPARNEETFIEQQIQCVVAQTLRPVRWVIVSDGSTDGTETIVRRHALEHPWIELLCLPQRTERHFAAKVRAFNTGYERVRHLPHQAVCSLDADITFGPDYFSFLAGKLAGDPALGLVGTPHVEDNRTYDFRFASLEHVSGACQFFRRECFEAIGGYRPIESGGVDLVAVLTCRIKGWKTRTFTERTCQHHRQMGSATKSGLAVLCHDGRKDYLLGAHPVWEVLRCLHRMLRPPLVIGGLALGFGYFSSLLGRRQKTAPPEVVTFRRREQMDRLRSILRREAGRLFRFGWRKAGSARSTPKTS